MVFGSVGGVSRSGGGAEGCSRDGVTSTPLFSPLALGKGPPPSSCFGGNGDGGRDGNGVEQGDADVDDAGEADTSDGGDDDCGGDDGREGHS
eukprot:7383477-Prymnesium_polylepis.1